MSKLKISLKFVVVFPPIKDTIFEEQEITVNLPGVPDFSLNIFSPTSHRVPSPQGPVVHWGPPKKRWKIRLPSAEFWSLLNFFLKKPPGHENLWKPPTAGGAKMFKGNLTIPWEKNFLASRFESEGSPRDSLRGASEREKKTVVEARMEEGSSWRQEKRRTRIKNDQGKKAIPPSRGRGVKTVT